MTHAELVQRAVKWLKTTGKCPIAFSEMVVASVHGYTPDAIGWRLARMSIVIECKVSRSDFLADRKKIIHKCPDDTPGQVRFYMTPPGLVRVDELPPGWGLLECHSNSVSKVHSADDGLFRAGRAASELPFLLSALRRVGLGVNWDEDAGMFQTITDQKALLAHALRGE